MYTITPLEDGTFQCSLRYQDGTETWIEPTRMEAICSMIRGARSYNHAYINHTMIKFEGAVGPVPVDHSARAASWKDGGEYLRYRNQDEITESEFSLLQEIRRGAKIVLDDNDYRLKANLLPVEVNTIIDIREGNLHIEEFSNYTSGT